MSCWASVTNEWHQRWQWIIVVNLVHDQMESFATIFPFIMVSGGQICDMEFSWVYKLLHTGAWNVDVWLQWLPTSLADTSFDSDGTCACVCVCVWIRPGPCVNGWIILTFLDVVFFAGVTALFFSVAYTQGNTIAALHLWTNLILHSHVDRVASWILKTSPNTTSITFYRPRNVVQQMSFFIQCWCKNVGFMCDFLFHRNICHSHRRICSVFGVPPASFCWQRFSCALFPDVQRGSNFFTFGNPIAV